MAPTGKEELTVVYQGSAPSCDVRGLHPNTSYSFRVVAVNAAGPSDVSSITKFETRPEMLPWGILQEIWGLF